MKMHLFWISMICLVIGLANGYKCPNWMFCDGICCPRFLYGGSYECCRNGYGCRYGILSGCNLAPQKIQVKEDSIMDRNIFPLSEPKDDSSIEESSEEVLQRGWLKDVLKKILAADIPTFKRN
ncbi:uncharacterized protein LOC129969343 [Argiope bruennichi]|uniref:Uncharacterized protein n=1 Tax=Argiope bruennichi TaxID=94029 RepID=A0A8T0FS61_ARGBR|nr:uncharacterized protein LOC129969343 [Argiope bruennichi]XP_055939855.1 uncharacterized protein LOC129969343 [Argiope bruennichi]XP_055939856.1 uncharacterized protein LOC129969343 [Argiope bruennichi]KAF8793018.1 hypothetical protein HNY73_004547 [Argiope bruennichi]